MFLQLRGSVAIRALLDEMDRKQRDMSSWPLTRPEDAGPVDTLCHPADRLKED